MQKYGEESEREASRALQKYKSISPLTHLPWFPSTKAREAKTWEAQRTPTGAPNVSNTVPQRSCRFQCFLWESLFVTVQRGIICMAG